MSVARQALKLCAPVSPVMVMRHIVCAPHPGVGRNRQDQSPARFQPGPDRLERGMVICNVFQDIEQRDQVKSAFRKGGKIRKCGWLDLSSKPLGRKCPCVGIKLGSRDAPEPREHFQIVTGAAPTIENGGELASAHGLGEKRRHEAAESLEPEMIALGERGGLQKSIHHADTIIDSVKNGR